MYSGLETVDGLVFQRKKSSKQYPVDIESADPSFEMELGETGDDLHNADGRA